MSHPTLLRFAGQTYICPSFCKVEIDGSLYLLDEEQKAALIDLDKEQGPRVTWKDTVRLFVTIHNLEPVTPEEADMKADWEVIVAALYHLPRCRQLTLSECDEIKVRELGDGYGQMTWEQLHELDILWDWSHIRDSSSSAIKAMAQKIRDLVARQ